MWPRLGVAISAFAKRVKADEKAHKEICIGVMSDVAVFDLWKVKEILEGVLFLVLPTQWGRTQTFSIGYIDDSLYYDASLTHVFSPVMESR